jgi:hypothetical protein
MIVRRTIVALICLALASVSGCESEPVANADAEPVDTSAPAPPVPVEAAAPGAEAAAAPAASAPATDAEATPPPADAPETGDMPPAAEAAPPAPAAADDPNLKKAVVGAGAKGRDYGGPGFVTTPVEVYFRTGDRIAFEVHIPKNMELYKAQHDNKGPKTHEEFMQVIIKEGRVDLPELPADEAYLYDPQTEQLMIRRMQPPATEAPPSK